jgi:hypothetical protein
MESKQGSLEQDPNQKQLAVLAADLTAPDAANRLKAASSPGGALGARISHLRPAIAPQDPPCAGQP